MVTPATLKKREQLAHFVQKKLAHIPAVRAVIGIGSIGAGTAHDGSDIDAAVFLDPLDLYVVPAEAIWLEPDDSFHSIFTRDETVQRDGWQFDFQRLDWRQWSDPAFQWPEPRLAELGAGWIAFDRDGAAEKLIAARFAYDDQTRITRLDEAITWLDQHLGEDGPRLRWQTLTPPEAHDRLNAAYLYLVHALFAYNRRWRPWRDREMTALLQLAWLPENFADRVLTALAAPGHDFAAYETRAEALQSLFQDILTRLTADGVYGDDPIDEAFIRRAEEPGRAWNMKEWNAEHRGRYP